MRGKIFIHVPFSMLREKLIAIQEKHIQPEIYFSAENLDELDKLLLRETAMSLRRSGLKCTIHAPFMDLPLGSPDPIIKRAVLERHRTLMPVVEILNPVCVVIHTGYDRWKYNGNLEEWLNIAQETLYTIRSMIPNSTTIAVENVFDESPDVLHMLTEAFDNSVGVCFDVGHFQLFSKSPLDEWLERLGKRIVELHLHNNDGAEDKHWDISRGCAPVWSLIKWAKDKSILAYTIEAHTEKEAINSYHKLIEFSSEVV